MSDAKKMMMGRTFTAKMKPHAPPASLAFPKMNRVPSSANEITFVTAAANASNTATTGGKRKRRNASDACSAIPIKMGRHRIERRAAEKVHASATRAAMPSIPIGFM